MEKEKELILRRHFREWGEVSGKMTLAIDDMDLDNGEFLNGLATALLLHLHDAPRIPHLVEAATALERMLAVNASVLADQEIIERRNGN